MTRTILIIPLLTHYDNKYLFFIRHLRKNYYCSELYKGWSKEQGSFAARSLAARKNVISWGLFLPSTNSFDFAFRKITTWSQLEGKKPSLLSPLPDAHRRAASLFEVTLCFISLQEEKEEKKKKTTWTRIGEGLNGRLLTFITLGFVHIPLPPFHLLLEPQTRITGQQ